MKKRQFAFGMTRTYMLLLISAAVLSTTAAWGVWEEFYREKFVEVGLTGIQHMGTKYKIDEFNVDGVDGGNVGWEGGGGSSSCCVRIPKKWKPGLSVMLRWAVGDWSKANRAETAKGNYESVVSGGLYRARIPIEKYAEAEDLYVHFFADGKARIVSSSFGRGIYHPIADSDTHAADNATRGMPVDQLFTEEEIAAVHKRVAEHTKRFGDWR